MSYNKELKEKSVKSADKNFDIIDNRFVFPNKLDLFVEEISHLNSIYNYSIKDNKGIEYFKCGYCLNNIVVYSLYGEPICNIQESTTTKSKAEICRGNGKEIIATIKNKDSITGIKFSVEFTNMLTEEKEVFDMNCDLNMRTCGIFYGKEKNGAPMLCKILRNFYYACFYALEISPEIDVSFMVALSLFFIKKSIKNTNGPSVVIKNYFNEIPYKEVEAPIHVLPVVDSKYINENKACSFKIEKSKNIISEYDFKIYGVDNVELFRSKLKSTKQIIQSSDNGKCIINLAESLDEGVKRKIFLEKKDEKYIGCIKGINSITINKYKLDFLNQETDFFESLIINCDPDYYLCTILYDNGQGNVSMVGKILKDQYEKRYYYIDIAPGVDQMIMFVIAIFFCTKSHYHIYT